MTVKFEFSMLSPFYYNAVSVFINIFEILDEYVKFKGFRCSRDEIYYEYSLRLATIYCNSKKNCLGIRNYPNQSEPEFSYCFPPNGIFEDEQTVIYIKKDSPRKSYRICIKKPKITMTRKI